MNNVVCLLLQPLFFVLLFVYSHKNAMASIISCGVQIFVCRFFFGYLCSLLAAQVLFHFIFCSFFFIVNRSLFACAHYLPRLHKMHDVICSKNTTFYALAVTETPHSLDFIFVLFKNARARERQREKEEENIRG